MPIEGIKNIRVYIMSGTCNFIIIILLSYIVSRDNNIFNNPCFFFFKFYDGRRWQIR
jgi:hypothetical protein